MAIPTPQRTIIDPNGNPQSLQTEIELATANGGVYVFDTTKDIYVTAVEQNYNQQFVNNQDLTQVTQEVYNNPAGNTTGEVQFYYAGGFSSAGANFSYNPQTTTLTVNNFSVSNLSNLGPIGKVQITGGTNGQVLSTDGTGALSWITPASNTPSTSANGNSNISILSNSAITMSANGQANIITITSSGGVATTNIANGVNISGDLTLGSNTSNAYINSNNVAFYDALVTVGTGANGATPSASSDQRKYRGFLIQYPNPPGSANTAWFGYNANSGSFELASNASVVGPNVTIDTYGDIELGTVYGNLVGNVSNSVFSNTSFAGNSKTIGFNAPGNLAASYTLTLPTTQGAAGYALTNDGTGKLSWTAVPGANSFVSNSITGNGVVNFSSASNVTLPNIANIHIPGGNVNNVLQTDGAGNLSWVAQAGAPTSITNGNSNVIVNANANITFSANGVENIVVISDDVSVGVDTPGLLTPYLSVQAPDGVTQFSEFVGNANNSVYFYLQNFSNGNIATSDIALSSDAGTDTQGYVDIGIASSTYNSNGIPIIKPQDSYVFAVGNSSANTANYSPGNLILGAFTDGNSRVKIGAGDAYSNTNILITLGNGLVNIDGTTTNVSSNLNASGNASFTGANVTLGNVANLRITGGANGQILTTNGSGTLSWAVPTLTYAKENFTANTTAPTGTINFDVLSNAIVYNTTAATGNITLNVRGNSSTTMDSVLANNQSTTITYLVTTGSTAYGVTTLQIDGTTVTPRWFGGTAPVFTINSISTYTYTIMKTGAGAYTVLASLGRYA